jgi:hypothetical protein
MLRHLGHYFWELGYRVFFWVPLVVGLVWYAGQSFAEGAFWQGALALLVAVGAPLVWAMIFYFGFDWIRIPQRLRRAPTGESPRTRTLDSDG